MVLQSVILAATADVNEGQAEVVRYQCAVCDTACGHTRDHVRRTEFTVDDVDELLADEGAHSGVGEGLPIVAIDRTLPTTRPRERLIGTKFDGLDLEQELRNLERWIER